MNIAAPGDVRKPLLRGVSHQYAFVASLVAGMWILRSVDVGVQQIAVGVFALSVSLLFGISALYHRVNWSVTAREKMRQLDHASIYVLISGTYTPIMWLKLDTNTACIVLAIVWGASAIGILFEFLKPRGAKWIAAAMYVAIGWVALFVMNPVIEAIGLFSCAVLVAGGVLYTAGAIIYALKKPNPIPRVFGHHEIFHLLVILGVVCHYYVVATL